MVTQLNYKTRKELRDLLKINYASRDIQHLNKNAFKII